MVQGDGAMKTRMAGRKRTREKQTAGQEIIASLNEAIRWAKGEEVPVRITTVHVPESNVQVSSRGAK